MATSLAGAQLAYSGLEAAGWDNATSSEDDAGAAGRRMRRRDLGEGSIGRISSEPCRRYVVDPIRAEAAARDDRCMARCRRIQIVTTIC
jgi:hypothetical protein